MCAVDNTNKPGTFLTVAGFDGTGGAGLQIDSKLSVSLQVPNISVVTSVVIQTPLEVQAAISFSPELVINQIIPLISYYDIRLVNIGIFGHLDTLKWIIDNLPRAKLIWDPIFSSGSGSYRFVNKSDIPKIQKLLNRFYLITPNIPETEELTDMEISSIEDMDRAIRKIQNEWGVRNILLKGGHLNGKESCDLLLHNDRVYQFKSEKSGMRIHGTGSFLNGAISAFLFLRNQLPDCVKKAKSLLEKAVHEVESSNPILIPPIR